VTLADRPPATKTRSFITLSLWRSRAAGKTTASGVKLPAAVPHYRIAPPKSLPSADNLPVKIYLTRATAERSGFLQVNCRPGKTFLERGDPITGRLFHEAGWRYFNQKSTGRAQTSVKHLRITPKSESLVVFAIPDIP